MAQLVVVYWRDIPTQVIVRQGRIRATRELPERFIQAVDRAAMRAGLRDSDSYLAEWRRGEPEAVGDDLEAAAEAALEALVTRYDAARLEALVRGEGRDSQA